jgi:uncharacterized protein
VLTVFIEIEDLKPEPLHVRHTYALGELPFEFHGAVLSEPVSTDFVLTHKDRDLMIGGSLTTDVRYTCSRCLKQDSRHLSTSFDLTYLPHAKGVRDGEEIELKYAEMEVGFYDGIRFDVDAMIVEQIVLSMPMRFVCSEDCKGLCHHCGKDLNEGACLCTDEVTDPRLSVLRDFRRKKDEN